MGRRILVAYDGSQLSKEAVEEGKKILLNEEDSELHVISVVTSAGPSTNALVMESITHELAKDLKIELKKVTDEFEEENLDIQTDVLIDHGQRNPGHQICKYAKEHDIDLIIAGSRGLSGIKKLFLGSVSNNIVQNAECRVLVIK